MRYSRSECHAGLPADPLRLILPFPAGSTPDLVARAIGPELSAGLGQPVVVDNRPGAGGNIGTDMAAKALDVIGCVGSAAADQFLQGIEPAQQHDCLQGVHPAVEAGLDARLAVDGAVVAQDA